MLSQFRLISCLFIFTLTSVRAQNCGNSVVPPATLNGVSITDSFTGSVSTFATPFTSCGLFTTPPNSIHIGQRGAFTYTMNFSQPVNNLVLLISATGHLTNEIFTFTTNTGTPTIIDNGSCFSTISANVLSSGLNSTFASSGGGGNFTITNSIPYTSITISGPGGRNGSLLSICDNSIVAAKMSLLNICIGECIDLIAEPITTSGLTTYQWDNGIQTNGDSTQVCPTINTKYSAIGIDSSGNVDTLIFDVKVNQLPQINLGPDTILCAENYLLLGKFGIDYSNVWNNGNTSPFINILDTGEYYVDVTDKITGCIGSDTILISAPLLSLNLGEDTSLCAPTSLLIEAGISNVDFEWNTGSNKNSILINSSDLYYVDVFDGWCQTSDSIQVDFIELALDLGNDIITCHPNIELDAKHLGAVYRWQDGSSTQTYLVSDSGLYFVEVTEPIAQCQISDTLKVFPGQINVDLGNDTLICNPDFIIKSAQNAGANYLWSTGETSQSISVNSKGQYIVDIIDGICSTSDTIIIDYSTPIADFTYSDTIGCDDQKVKFVNTTNPSTQLSTVIWHFGDGHISNEKHANHFFSQPGNYEVLLETMTEDDCRATHSKIINVNIIPSPNIDITFSPNQPNVGDKVSFDNQYTNAENWSWDFGDGTTSIELNPSHSFGRINNFKVIMTANNEHCENTDFIIIPITEELLFYVPNAFTPNAYGSNDFFAPIFTSGFNPYDYHLLIFNRWGEIIFESYDASIGWNGMYNGALAQKDTYIWQIQFADINNDNQIIERGHITLLK